MRLSEIAYGQDLYQVICREDLEGIVAKHKLAPYASSPQNLVQGLEYGLHASSRQEGNV